MAIGSSTQAMMRTGPWHFLQLSMSILNTRFKLGPGHRCVALAEAAIILILTNLLTPLAPACGSDLSPMLAVRGEHTVESSQINSRFGEKVSPPPH
jgi:hypothetical protein